MSYIKIESLQSGPFNKNYNNVEFNIPAEDYDFSKSYLNFMCTVNDNNAGKIAEVYLTNGNNDDVPVFSSSLVENISFETEQTPNMINIRKHNIISQNLKNYTLSRSDKLSLANSDIYGIVGSRGYKSTSLFRQINRLGNVPSRNIESSVKADLSDFEGLGQLMPLSKLGKGRLHLELQPDLVKPHAFNMLVL